jgi:hypothetical protein
MFWSRKAATTSFASCIRDGEKRLPVIPGAVAQQIVLFFDEGFDLLANLIRQAGDLSGVLSPRSPYLKR